MDETVKPLRIPVAMATYGDTHQLSHLMQDLLSVLLLHRPEDPLSFLIRTLRNGSESIPRVLLLGPPAVGKTTVAQHLKTELKTVHLTATSLLEDQSLHSAEDQQDLPDQVLVSLLQKRLTQEDCWTQGWVLEGFPWTRLQALSLQQAGILPQHVVLLEAPDVVLQQRGDGRLLDSLTGDVYHRTFAWPADDVVAQRLEKGRRLSGDQVRQHRREVTGLSSAYQQVLLVVNGDQPPADVSQQVLSFVQTRRCSRTPRILLFGPPGSGKSHQAKLLSEKYRLVDVCCAQVLRAAAAEGSRPGQLIQTYLDQDRAVPDSVVLQVLEDRLSREDCSVRGWILHGFPRDLQQARVLQQRPLQPNRVFFLEATDEVCLERISLRATDAVSGNRFHAVTQPAPSSVVQNRLRTRPEDSMDTVRENLRHYRGQTAVLQSFYPGVIHINADQDPHSVFELLESRLTTN